MEIGDFTTPDHALRTLLKHVGVQVGDGKITAVPQSSSSGKKTEYSLGSLPGVFKDATAKVAYVHMKSGALEAAWELSANLEESHLYAHVSADGKRVLSLADLTARASYNVVQLGDIDPEISGRTLVVDPAHKAASPYGWHDFGNGTVTNSTVGNNAWAQVWPGLGRPFSGFRPESETLDFDYHLDINRDPNEYKSAAVTNAFYMCNIMHDISYMYGFNEPAGNFQTSNFGKGGKEGDAVIVNVHDTSAVNNAFFSVMPDGKAPRLGISIYMAAKGRRDGSLVNAIIAHEYGHG
ncbi:Fungalysin metallopeptidase-domain-containing protein, partial [Thamnocephalis sphaerospora]